MFVRELVWSLSANSALKWVRTRLIRFDRGPIDLKWGISRTEKIWTAYAGRKLLVGGSVLLLSVAPAFLFNHARKGLFRCLMLRGGH
ncbi:hypothetical protein BDV19DRAFT_375265 [Aspergillus venezuelensis]